MAVATSTLSVVRTAESVALRSETILICLFTFVSLLKSSKLWVGQSNQEISREEHCRTSCCQGCPGGLRLRRYYSLPRLTFILINFSSFFNDIFLIDTFFIVLIILQCLQDTLYLSSTQRCNTVSLVPFILMLSGFVLVKIGETGSLHRDSGAKYVFLILSLILFFLIAVRLVRSWYHDIIYCKYPIDEKWNRIDC